MRSRGRAASASSCSSTPIRSGRPTPPPTPRCACSPPIRWRPSASHAAAMSIKVIEPDDARCVCWMRSRGDGIEAAACRAPGCGQVRQASALQAWRNYSARDARTKAEISRRAAESFLAAAGSIAVLMRFLSGEPDAPSDPAVGERLSGLVRESRLMVRIAITLRRDSRVRGLEYYTGPVFEAD